MIISVNAEHPSLIKTLSKLGREGNFLNLIKGIYKKPMVNIIPNHESLNAFLLRLGTKQRCLLLPLLFDIALEVLASA